MGGVQGLIRKGALLVPSNHTSVSSPEASLCVGTMPSGAPGSPVAQRPLGLHGWGWDPPSGPKGRAGVGVFPRPMASKSPSHSAFWEVDAFGLGTRGPA